MNRLKKLEKWDISVSRMLLGLDSGAFSLPLSSEALKEVTQPRQTFKSSHTFNRITVRLLVVSEASDLKGGRTLQLRHWNWNGLEMISVVGLFWYYSWPSYSYTFENEKIKMYIIVLNYHDAILNTESWSIECEWVLLDIFADWFFSHFKKL